MNWNAISYDWNHIRAFLAVVEEGSFSAAARVLGQTQPTLSRQISGLEEALEVTLFERGTRAMALTDSGSALLSHVEKMTEAATQISRIATGQSEAITGTVRVSSSDAMTTFVLPECMINLRKIHPGISIELIPSNNISDLTRRDADIAIRHIRPEQPDLVAKRLSDIEVTLFASATYMEKLGEVNRPEDLADAEFIGYESPDRLIPQLNAIGIPLTRENFCITTPSGTAMFELARAGAGIAILPTATAEGRLGLQRVLPDMPTMEVPVWLVTHREIQTNRRIRITFDHLSEELGRSGEFALFK
ncbi:MAG: LysR family transcriptional regulator, partial [Pseudomonadota bacterium]